MRLRRLILSALLLPTLLLSVLACAPANGAVNPAGTTAPATGPVEVTDQLGRTVKFSQPPQRIVSIAPSNTELVYALGLQEILVGVTDYDTYPPEAKEKSSVGGYSNPNMEKLLALTPDLVLATGVHRKTVIPQLEEKGLTVLALDPKTITQVREAVTLMGKVTGKTSEAAKLVSDMQKRVNAVTDKTAKLSGDQITRALYVVWPDPLKVAGANTFHDELITKAGGKNVAGELTGYPAMSLEAVIDKNPEVVIAGVSHGSGGGAPYNFAKDEPRLKDISARQTGRVHALDADIANRAGPRIVDALEEFAKMIHPELFGASK